MILLSNRGWRRLQAVRRVERGKWTMAEAAQAVGVTTRHMRRICRAVEAQGEAGLVHGNCGRAAPNRRSEEQRRRVMALHREKYAGFNDAHFTEKLASVEGVKVSRSTVRRWLRAEGIGAARRRRPPKHRRRRDRKPQAGQMVLWDGSRHDWLEGRGPMLCLVGAIDDATSDFLPGAHFVEHECSVAYLRVLRALATGPGLPWSCYGDRHSIFRRNDDAWTLEEELRGRQDPTQLGRALEALGIERIDALSPQAKGRVERLWGTAQDRLTSELRLANASTAAEANLVLARYRPEHNTRFAVPPSEAASAWRPVVRSLDLDRLLSFYYEATVQKDKTVRIAGRIIDIPPGPGKRTYAGIRAEVRQLLDGSWRIYHRDTLIATAPPSDLEELAPKRVRKRPVASRAFRDAVLRL